MFDETVRLFENLKLCVIHTINQSTLRNVENGYHMKKWNGTENNLIHNNPHGNTVHILCAIFNCISKQIVEA